jgi:hypothetical protein
LYDAALNTGPERRGGECARVGTFRKNWTPVQSAVMAAFGADAYRPASQAASVTGAWADDYDERLVRAGGDARLTECGRR